MSSILRLRSGSFCWGSPASIVYCSSSLRFGLVGFGLCLPGLIIERRWHCMKKKLVVPKFRNEDEESDWWAGVNLADYFDASDFVHFDPEKFMARYGRPQTKRITMRVPAAWIAKAKERA